MAFLVILINKFLVNRKKMDEIKRMIEEIRVKIAEAQKNKDMESASKLLNELMKLNSEQLRQSLLALVVSMLLIAIILPWMKYRYEGMVILKLPFSLPLIGNSLSWFIWYFLVSFAIGFLLRKIFGV